MKIFAERLLELRKEHGISQAALAKRLEVSYGVVCYWETNRSEPTAPNLVKIADFFDVSIDYLLGRTEEY
ncbi:MAG: helix-turn-helix transcriptional regulator [Clostridia bacterium]|nr:helix-turn-helix transcriptional regulator [Clostridia bacterium]